jgi:hypothetical protein
MARAVDSRSTPSSDWLRGAGVQRLGSLTQREGPHGRQTANTPAVLQTELPARITKPVLSFKSQSLFLDTILMMVLLLVLIW